MLNPKERPGKQTKGVKMHRQERGEQPQKKGQQDVFGDHCHLTRFVFMSCCCYENNRSISCRSGGQKSELNLMELKSRCWQGCFLLGTAGKTVLPRPFQLLAAVGIASHPCPPLWSDHFSSVV